MAYITASQATAASRQRYYSRGGAVTEIKKSATASARDTFDVFLSHSYEDAEVVAGIKALLEQEGMSAYVDWIDDSQLSRASVTAATADRLRARMKNCRFLLFLTSKTSPNSKWMPWELGYFDGFRSNKVGILPIVQHAGQSFTGQEYLGLYPDYELIELVGYGRRLARRTGRNEAALLSADVQ